MIERRRPILSAIANRKMFMGGGLATPMPQPTYMDLMPQQMGIPREAQGIMASSQPLVDAIASDANNPYGGDTLSMAQGGVAKFQRGGVQYDPATAVTRAQRTPSENLQTLFPPERAAGLLDQIGIGKGPGELYSDEPSFTRRIVGMVPGRAGTALEGAAEVGEKIGNVVDSFLGARFRGQKNILAYLFNEEEEASGRSLDERYGLKEILSRISPELKQQNPNIERDILEIGANLIGKTGSQQEYMGAIADQYAKQQEAGYAAAMVDANRGQVDAVSDEGFPAPQQPGDIVMPSDEGEFYREELNKKIDEYRVAMGQGPEAQMKFAQDLSADPNFSQAFKDDVFQSADVGSPVDAGAVITPEEPPTDQKAAAAAAGDAMSSIGMDDTLAGGATPDAAAAAMPRPAEKPPAPDIAQGQVAPTVDTAPSATGETTPDTSAAAQVAKAFDKPMTEPEAKKTIEDYKRRFMEAMPEYKGVSEEEKALRFVEAGLRVMAGQSPNAIENIANGLKGIGDQFAKDNKEKRAYNRQVELSAAKYAVESVAKDDAKLDALAKEGRARTTFIVGKTFTDSTGVTRKAGSIYNPTASEIGTEDFQKNILPNLTTEGIYKGRLDNSSALTGITRVGAKHGPSAEGVTKALNAYTDLTKDVRNNAKMLTMLDASILRNAQGKITGFAPWASSKLNNLRNAAGYKKEIKIMDGIDTSTGRGLEKFQYQQQVIANMMLKEILGEGSKNVSNIDRTLASEIVGLLKDFKSITADDALLNQKLQGIRGVVEQGLQTNLSKMRNSELGFRNVFTAIGPGDTGLVPVSGEMARQRRELLGDIRGVGQRVQERSQVAGRGPVVLKASDYFDFEKGTIKKSLPR